jgi:hypothetical protein
MISFYYRNWLLSGPVWSLTRLAFRMLFRDVPGRGRLGHARSVDDFVRAYDGARSPLGKVYSRADVMALLQEMRVDRVETHYFPSRFMLIGRRLPRLACRVLDRACGLMLYVAAYKSA